MNGEITLLDAALRVFPRVLLFDGGRYLIATLIMSTVLYFAHRTALRARIIQSRTATPADYRRELLASLRTVFVYAAVDARALAVAQRLSCRTV